jgi:hypothetical protein
VGGGNFPRTSAVARANCRNSGCGNELHCGLDAWEGQRSQYLRAASSESGPFGRPFCLALPLERPLCAALAGANARILLPFPTLTRDPRDHIFQLFTNMFALFLRILLQRQASSKYGNNPQHKRPGYDCGRSHSFLLKRIPPTHQKILIMVVACCIAVPPSTAHDCEFRERRQLRSER